MNQATPMLKIPFFVALVVTQTATVDLEPNASATVIVDAPTLIHVRYSIDIIHLMQI